MKNNNSLQSSINKIGLLTAIVLHFGCNNSNNLKQTVKVCDNMYIEIYSVSGGGAFGADEVKDYLTDSLNFRVAIGQYDEIYGGYYYQCSNDSITVIEHMKKEIGAKIQNIRINSYSLKKLKALNNIQNKEIIQINDDLASARVSRVSEK